MLQAGFLRICLVKTNDPASVLRSTSEIQLADSLSFTILVTRALSRLREANWSL